MNKFGSTLAPDAAYQVSRSPAIWLEPEKKIFKGFWHGSRLGHVTIQIYI